MLYLRKLRQPLGSIRIPLAENDPDVRLNVQEAISRVWDVGAYAVRIKYDAPCVPSLPPADQAWADELIRAALPKTAS